MHYQQSRNGGVVTGRKRAPFGENVGGECSIQWCDKPRLGRSGEYCSMHYQRKRSGVPMDRPPRSRRPNAPGEWGPWRAASGGYVRRTGVFDGVNKHEFQHRFFMEQHLGRALLPGENVHHKNGNRADNRLENLELWNTVQPQGQLPEGKVAYAVEILEEYLQMNWTAELANRLHALLEAGPLGANPAQVRRETS